MDYVISVVIGLVILALAIAIGAYVLPWLKQKGLIGVVDVLVAAAEKMAENQQIDKKAWVLSQLVKLGIKITPFMDACVEAAVKRLDIAMGKIGEGKGGGNLAE